ncbi:HdaA/DnaA family protein [Stenoxybacter acetivorans]|uniref:HdaA/DnaA family protein n=1 Tax=Stenoxybacter acetivorans TaxID=422441 RepID=UPI00055CC21C|nr:DnaA/Hda family protein [Stenoxybacter acetivorans]
MNQLILDFADNAYPDSAAFLGNSNHQLREVLQSKHEAFVYVWDGEVAFGRDENSGAASIVLKAWAAEMQKKGYAVMCINAAVISEQRQLADDAVFSQDAVVIGNIDYLDAANQHRLFELFNHFRNRASGQLLLSAAVPPAGLTVREDLRTRLAYCLVYELKPLNDEEKAEALMQIANAWQIPVDRDVFRYLLQYGPRDWGSLMTILLRISHDTLQYRRRVTLPLIRELLQQEVP